MRPTPIPEKPTLHCTKPSSPGPDRKAPPDARMDHRDALKDLRRPASPPYLAVLTVIDIDAVDLEAAFGSAIAEVNHWLDQAGGDSPRAPV